MYSAHGSSPPGASRLTLAGIAAEPVLLGGYLAARDGSGMRSPAASSAARRALCSQRTQRGDPTKARVFHAWPQLRQTAQRRSLVVTVSGLATMSIAATSFLEAVTVIVASAAGRSAEWSRVGCENRTWTIS